MPRYAKIIKYKIARDGLTPLTLCPFDIRNDHLSAIPYVGCAGCSRDSLVTTGGHIEKCEHFILQDRAQQLVLCKHPDVGTSVTMPPQEQPKGRT
jgi:hypothetical protein